MLCTTRAGLTLAGILLLLSSVAVNSASAQSVDLVSPTDLIQLGPVVSWTDNASDEDGYRLEIRLSSPSEQPVKTFTYDVAADVTTFTIPTEAMTTCEYYTSTTSVVAFRGRETSQPVRRGVVVECEPTLDSLPAVGTGSPAKAHGPVMLAIALTLFSLGAAILKAGSLRGPAA